MKFIKKIKNKILARIAYYYWKRAYRKRIIQMFTNPTKEDLAEFEKFKNMDWGPATGWKNRTQKHPPTEDEDKGHWVAPSG